MKATWCDFESRAAVFGPISIYRRKAGVGERTYGLMSSLPDKPNILLVEDDPSLGLALVRYLQAIGYAPVHCASGAAAMEAVDDVTPDAVITDVHLPDINGLILSQKLRERLGPDVPIIVLSGDTSTEVLKSLSHVGATYFFNKPVNLDLLKQHLAEQLASPAD